MVNKKNFTSNNNKLIAEFMGWKKVFGKYEIPYFKRFISSKLKTANQFTTEEMLFNTSWDWIMPVLEKISEIKFINIRVDLSPNVKDCLIEAKFKEENKLFYCVEKNTLESFYKTIIKFLIWYNKIKE